MSNQKGIYNGWAYRRVKNSWFFDKLFTFSGSIYTIDFSPLTFIQAALYKDGILPGAFEINRIEQIFNDATSRDYSIRFYTDPAINAYVERDAATGNTNLNTMLEGNFKYPAEMQIEFYYLNFTVGKTVRIRIQADELK